MASDDIGGDDSDGWDPDLTRRLIDAATPLVERWFRPEVRGLESIPRKFVFIPIAPGCC